MQAVTPNAPPEAADAATRPPLAHDPAAQRRLAALLVILALGLMVRAIHFAAIRNTAFIDFPVAADQSDMWGFWTWSSQILAGDFWGRDTWHPYTDWMSGWGSPADWHRWWGNALTFQQEPFYPYALAGVRALGAGFSTIVWLQLLASTLAAWPVYALARRFTSEFGALAAALLVVLYGPLVFYAGALLRDWLAALIEPALVLGALVVSQRARRRALAWGGLGVAMGAALLAKYTTLLLIVGLIGWAITGVWRDRREVSLRAGPLLLGIVVGLSPLLVRNAVVGAPLFEICNRPLEGFVMANVADVVPIGMQISPNDAQEVLRKAEGHMATAVIETLRTYDGDVGLFLSRQWTRLRALVDPFEVPNNLSLDYGKHLSPILGWLPGWGLLLPFGVAGLLLAIAAPRRHSILLVYAVAIVAATLTQFIIDRYRLGIATLFCVTSGILLGELHRQLRQGQWRPCAAAAAIIVCVAVLQQRVLALPPGDIHVVETQGYGLAVAIYTHRGNFAAAEREVADLRELSAKRPHQRVQIGKFANLLEGSLLMSLSQRSFQAGQREAATQQLLAADRALSESFDVPDLQLDLAILHERFGQPQLARERAEYYLARQPEGSRAEDARTLLRRISPAQ